MAAIDLLTENQKKELIAEYVSNGIAIGLATGPEMNEAEVRRLTDAHRVACGVPKADIFLVYDSPFEAIKKHPYLNPSNALFGQHDIHWLMSAKYIEEIHGDTTLKAQTENLFELSKRVCWMWMSSNTTIVTRRAKHLRTIEKPSNNGEKTKVLHSYDSLAMEFADGTGVYAINGIRIPKEYHWVVTTPVDKLDPSKVMNIKNTEIRTEAIKKLGVVALFDRLNKVTLDTATINPGGKYELFKIDLGGVQRVYLKGNCPSSGDPFFEGVPPELKTCGQALNWREFGTTEVEYVPPMVRT